MKRWRTDIEMVSQLLEYMREMNESVRIYRQALNEKMPTYETWRKVKHEMLEIIILELLMAQMIHVKVFNTPSGRLPESLSKAEKRAMDPDCTADDNTDPHQRNL